MEIVKIIFDLFSKKWYYRVSIVFWIIICDWDGLSVMCLNHRKGSDNKDVLFNSMAINYI